MHFNSSPLENDPPDDEEEPFWVFVFWWAGSVAVLCATIGLARLLL